MWASPPTGVSENCGGFVKAALQGLVYDRSSESGGTQEP